MSSAVQKQFMCRTCMTKNASLVSIFDTPFAKDATKIKDVLPLCASVQIYFGDGLPDCICTACADELKRAYLFKRKCEESDSTLRSQLVTLKQEPLTGSDVVCNQPEPFVVKFIKVDCEETSEEFLDSAASHSKCEQKNEGVHKDTNILNNNSVATVSCDRIEFVNVVNHPTSITSSKDIIENNRDKKPLTKRANKETHQCATCCKKFSRKDRLKVHMMRHTGEVGRHTCHTCGKGFFTSYYLKKHERYHSEEKAFLCSVCGKRFRMAQNLDYHLTTHSGLKPHKCETCGKHFSLKISLNAHVRTHSGERPFGCAVCGKLFGTKGNLTTHRKIHGDEKPFVCDVCGKRFLSSPCLVRHQRTHTGEKPCECNVCGEHFVSSAVLKNHMLTHTGEKPYVCEHCGQAFRQRGTLVTHRNRVHLLKGFS